MTDLCKEEDILLNKSADKKEIQQARVGSANSNSKVYMTRRREQQTKEESKESLTISFTSTANNLDMSNGSYEELAKSFEKIDYFKRETGQTPQDIFSSLLEIAEEERIKHSGRFKRFGRKEDRGKNPNIFYKYHERFILVMTNYVTFNNSTSQKEV